MNIKVESLQGFYELIKSVNKIAPGAIFVINKNGCSIKSRNESASIRAFFSSNVIKLITNTDEIIKLSFLELSKLLTSIKLCIETNKDIDSVEFKSSPQFLSYNGSCKFKLKLQCDDNLLLAYTTEALKLSLQDIFSFDITNEKFKYILKYRGITGDKDPKIYIYLNDDNVYAEFDDKTKNLCDSLGIPITNTYIGTVSNQICINVNNNFSKFNPLESDIINIALQDKPCLKIKSIKSTENYIIKCEIISKILEK